MFSRSWIVGSRETDRRLPDQPAVVVEMTGDDHRGRNRRQVSRGIVGQARCVNRVSWMQFFQKTIRRLLPSALGDVPTAEVAENTGGFKRRLERGNLNSLDQAICLINSLAGYQNGRLRDLH